MLKDILLFIPVAAVYSGSPGPAVFLAITTSVLHGVKPAIAAVLGNTTGLLISALVATVGVGAIIAASPLLFNIIKTIGALYIIYLGIKMLLKRRKMLCQISTAETSHATIRPFVLYKQGLFVALSNPKPFIFFIAVFPHFVDHHYRAWPQLLLLAVLFALLSCLIMSSYANVANILRKRLVTAKAQQIFAGGSGIVFIVIGVLMLLPKLL